MASGTLHVAAWGLLGVHSAYGVLEALRWQSVRARMFEEQRRRRSRAAFRRWGRVSATRRCISSLFANCVSLTPTHPSFRTPPTKHRDVSREHSVDAHALSPPSHHVFRTSDDMVELCLASFQTI